MHTVCNVAISQFSTEIMENEKMTNIDHMHFFLKLFHTCLVFALKAHSISSRSSVLLSDILSLSLKCCIKRIESID